MCLTTGGGGGWHEASVSDCLPLAAPIGLSPLLILTLCGPERVLVVSTEPLDDLSCVTNPGVGCPGDRLDQVHGGGGGGQVNLAVGNLAEARHKESGVEHAKPRGMGGQSRKPLDLAWGLRRPN